MVLDLKQLCTSLNIALTLVGGPRRLVERQHVNQSDVKDYICHKGPDMLKKGAVCDLLFDARGGGVEATVFILQGLHRSSTPLF